MPERSAVRVHRLSVKSTLLVAEIASDAYTPEMRALKERPRHRAALRHANLCDSLEALRVNGARRVPSGLTTAGFGVNLDGRLICGAAKRRKADVKANMRPLKTGPTLTDLLLSS